jgi:hypothetical protein
MVTDYWLKDRGLDFRQGQEFFCLPFIQAGVGTDWGLSPRRQSYRGVKLTYHYLVPRLRMHGSLFHSLYTPLWRGS